jgi:phosphatidylglycerophosphate synthase
VTGLRGVSATQGLVMGSSDIAKYKTAFQYLAITLLILEKTVPTGLEAEYVYLSRGMLWAAMILTVVSGIEYFVRFYRSTDLGALVREDDRWR